MCKRPLGGGGMWSGALLEVVQVPFLESQESGESAEYLPAPAPVSVPGDLTFSFGASGPGAVFPRTP